MDWVMLREFPLYEIHSDGRIRNIVTKRELVQCRRPDFDNVASVHLNKTEFAPTQMRYVHRLLATAFIPNPLGKKCVIFKDNNRANYTLSNLEWATQSEVNSRVKTHPRR